MPKRSEVAFTDAFVKSAVARDEKRTSYFDQLTPGLELRVSKTGRAWAYRYRDDAGRSVRLSLGLYPATKLKDARDLAIQARGKIVRGGDPHADRKQHRANARAERIKTVGDLCDAFLDHGETNFKATTLAADRQRIKRYIRPALGSLRVGSVTRANVRQLVNDIGKGLGRCKGRPPAPVQANRVATLIGRLYGFANAECDMGLTNPAEGMQATFEEASRERTLTDEELRTLWGALCDPTTLDVPTLSEAMGECLKLCAIVLQRANEVAGIDERELDFEQRTWLIPAARMKNKREHLVPLPPEAIVVLKRAMALRPRDAKTGKPVTTLLFPSPRDPSKPFTRRAVTRAMTRVSDAIADKQREEHLASGGKLEGFTPVLTDCGPHDLRRTGATAITSERIGIPRFTVSLVLGHISETGGVTGVYDRNAYLSEKRRALDAWAALLMTIVEKKPRRENVVKIRAGGKTK